VVVEEQVDLQGLRVAPRLRFPLISAVFPPSNSSVKPIGKPVTATQRFHAEAAKRKVPPLTLLLGGIGAAFLAVVGFILFGAKGGGEDLYPRFEELRAAGAELQSRGRLDDAAAKYREAIDLAGADEKLKIPVVDLKARLREMKKQRGDLAAARAVFDSFRARAEKPNPEDLAGLLQEGKQLLEGWTKAGVPWLEAHKGVVAGLEAAIEKRREETDQLDFIRTRTEIAASFRLGEKGIPHDWSGAIRKWKQYLTRPIRADDAPKARREIETINQMAREDLRVLHLRAQREVESGRKGEALRSLEKERPRFELTSVYDDLEKLRQELAR